jgi:carbon-monoxide dehydrogenase medium subunit
MSGFRYARPATVEEAVDLLSRHDGEAHLLAGGTALALLMKQGLIEPGVLVDLAGIPGLADVAATPDGGVAIGALRPMRRIERDAVVIERHPALASTVARVATVRVRNQATLGGNLAHADPAQDPPPMLLVLDAAVEAAGPDGRRTIPLDGFFVDVFETALGPAEILTGVLVPPLPARSRVRYEKFLPRTADDYATVSAAARLTFGEDGRIADARIALGAAGPVPLRVPAAEDLLRGRAPADVDLAAVADAARDTADPVDDVRGSADYKREMAGVWAARAVGRILSAEAAGGATGGATA